MVLAALNWNKFECLALSCCFRGRHSLHFRIFLLLFLHGLPVPLLIFINHIKFHTRCIVISGSVLASYTYFGSNDCIIYCIIFLVPKFSKIFIFSFWIFYFIFKMRLNIKMKESQKLKVIQKLKLKLKIRKIINFFIFFLKLVTSMTYNSLY